jgi:hypothetical protein
MSASINMRLTRCGPKAAHKRATLATDKQLPSVLAMGKLI